MILHLRCVGKRMSAKINFRKIDRKWRKIGKHGGTLKHFQFGEMNG